MWAFDERDHSSLSASLHGTIRRRAGVCSWYHIYYWKSQDDLPCTGSNNKLNDETNNIVYNDDCMSTDHHSTSMLCPSWPATIRPYCFSVGRHATKEKEDWSTQTKRTISCRQNTYNQWSNIICCLHIIIIRHRLCNKIPSKTNIEKQLRLDQLHTQVTETLHAHHSGQRQLSDADLESHTKKLKALERKRTSLREETPERYLERMKRMEEKLVKKLERKVRRREDRFRQMMMDDAGEEL